MRKNMLEEKSCKECSKGFFPDKNFREYCSIECYDKHRKAKLKNKISYRTFHKILHRAFPDWKCPFCEWKESFAVHHIDGRGNNNFDSLVMLCPNHHSAAHLNMFSKEELRQHAIGNKYSKEYLLLTFYGGKNSEINFTQSDGNEETNKRMRKERKDVTFLVV